MNGRKKWLVLVLACCLSLTGCQKLTNALSSDNISSIVNEAQKNPEKAANDIVSGANDLLSDATGMVSDVVDGDIGSTIGNVIGGVLGSDGTAQPATTSSAHTANTNVPGFVVPDYNGQPYVTLNNNQPWFPVEALDYAEPFEIYSELDSFGRCGAAFANVCKELMPTDDRGSIGSVKPSGWQSVTYDFVDGKYLYNRCHLVGYQLAGENANEKNLITGTRYLNIKGMLPFENWVDDYVEETGNHVLYRVTPVFEDWDLVAQGVIMEGYSVEDKGEGICFNVFCFNVQPGVVIDYATGESQASDAPVTEEAPAQTTAYTPAPDDISFSTDYTHYVVNTNTRKFHSENCSLVDTIAQENREDYFGTRQDCLDEGYSPCGKCNP